MKVSKDPRTLAKSGVTLGSTSKDLKEGKSNFEKKARRAKRVDRNVAAMLEKDASEPTKEVLNQKLRDLGVMEAEKFKKYGVAKVFWDTL